MGWPPETTRATTLGDFVSAQRGWAAHHCPEPEGDGLGADDVAALKRMMTEG